VHQFHSASAAALDSMQRGSNLVNLQLSISLARVVGLRSVHRADDFARYVGHANATNTRQRHANKMQHDHAREGKRSSERGMNILGITFIYCVIILNFFRVVLKKGIILFKLPERR
jgi:hypothetical protein